MKIGLDVGSTTLKCVVLDDSGKIIYSKYERHLSLIAEKSAEMLREAAWYISPDEKPAICVTGSAGMGFAESIGIPFVQEVYATRTSVKKYIPDSDVIIELGGEDAKILFVSGAQEVRMNGSCAGGTGAFIDQMATLLDVTPGEMDELAKNSVKRYSIASRCGVFAKSDIQPLLNQGARREDISASIFAAVVNQTIAGLSQGREIKGRVVYLGGPLTFFRQLRAAFDRELKLEGICPENSLYYVAIGAALHADRQFDIASLSEKIGEYKGDNSFRACPPLFENREQYERFVNDHKDKVRLTSESLCADRLAYIGIDAGSTTVKAVVINSAEEVVFTKYMRNSGNPVPLVKDILTEIYDRFPYAIIAGSACTGYGEEIIKRAFHIDCGIVETIAHFTAAEKYDPKVDYIIDIGGQDIKCFRIKDGAIDDIFLNEACSSGCGSFLQTFAAALGYDIKDFAKLAVTADRPVDLGSRCTVFMNSSVKQAQKDGASVPNISAGLSVSVVKNALYKVIRISGSNRLGKHIVVQGGTFLNDAVLRAFEQEIGYKVTRPELAGVMGAFGAALWAKHNRPEGKPSATLSKEALEKFTHEVKAVTCRGCTNACKLTVNTFDDGSRFIGGNRCDKPVTGKASGNAYNIYEYKRSLLSRYGNVEGRRETIGIPMGLNMYELLPFWHTLLRELGFGIMLSPPSSRRLYRLGQATIP
ncbi:MAG: 2-hydroxyglutaryl-CoA dehydratase, partial [Clostridia bacterium]|nr:2-hydroxyglutaryl-CoA dehydratase [Clostridia bacterium]